MESIFVPDDVRDTFIQQDQHDHPLLGYRTAGGEDLVAHHETLSQQLDSLLQSDQGAFSVSPANSVMKLSTRLFMGK
jgi:hypothetical protein